MKIDPKEFMMKQRVLFGQTATLPLNKNIPVNHSVHEDARERLSTQCQDILEMLKGGRASNRNLSTIALKYTSRVSDLRKAGYDIRVVEKDHRKGKMVYALFVDGIEVEQCVS